MSLEEELSRYESVMERLVASYKARMASICKSVDLTPPQFWALHTIQDAGRIKMSPLADCLGLSMGAASTLVDRLVGRGLVQREADPDDRRAVFVSLTDKGERVLDEGQSARRELNKLAFSHMVPDTRLQLVNGLEALVTAWESMAAADRKPS